MCSSLFTRVLVENPQVFKWSLLFKAFPGLIVIILRSGHYCGVHQIFDADIDMYGYSPSTYINQDLLITALENKYSFKMPLSLNNSEKKNNNFLTLIFGM